MRVFRGALVKRGFVSLFLAACHGAAPPPTPIEGMVATPAPPAASAVLPVASEAPTPTVAPAPPRPPPRFLRWHADHVELLRPIEFDYDKATLRKASFELLDELSDEIKAHPEATKIEIQGHYPPKYPYMAASISDKRARSVMKYLVYRGVESKRLMAKGYGGDRPLFDPETPEGKAKNRRIEIRILPP